MNAVISAIAIDLGSKYTGVFQCDYPKGALPQKQSCQSYTLVLPQTGFSQQQRTATRHQVRNNNRRKMIKRLLGLALNQLCERYDVGLTHRELTKVTEAVNGLMNRRGYNRLQTEFDENELNQCEPLWFNQYLGDYFTSTSIPLSQQWLSLIQNPENIHQLQQHPVFSANNKELDRFFKDFADQKKAIKAVLKGLKSELTKLEEQFFSGHQHRKDYLDAILKEIQQDSRLKKVRETVGIKPLWRLIGNLSNFQLRASRWYFNDPAMSEADYWDPTRLHKVFVRWLEYWSPKTPEEKAQRRSALHLFECTPDVLDALCRLPPELSIPPYENQNNRRPPKDQTLWLNPEKLQRQFPKWRYWSQILLRKHPEYMEGIDEILCLYDRKSRLPDTRTAKQSKTSLSIEDFKLSYGLQRILDRNSHLDEYRLRLLVKKRTSKRTEMALSSLERDLGSQHLEGFIALCSQYYSEVTSAKVGLWLDQPTNLLERSDLNPPHKKKLRPILVSNVLKVDLDAVGLRAFLRELWNKPIAKYASIENACGAIEKTRKEYGDQYHNILKLLRTRIEVQGFNPAKLSEKEGHKAIWKSWTNTLLVSAAIQKYFGHTQQQLSKYQNPYSLAQLYNILEAAGQGFSAITLAAHLENTWRMKQVTVDGIMRSRCSRLPADSIRPFDGVLRRVLEQQAWEIAKLKADHIKAAPHHNTKIYIPIIIEQNRFTSAIELITLKERTKANEISKKKAVKQLAQEQSQWLDKQQRIKEASMGICPYSGKALGTQGEVDHILSRAVSSLTDDTSYNSEPNLIWCLGSSNQKKGASRYGLDDLHDRYLNAQFGCQDSVLIRKEIETQVSSLPANFAFAALTKHQQRAVRHALFLEDDSEAYKKVKLWLKKQKTARVNGTQSWLVHKIKQCLTYLLEEWCQERQCQLQFNTAAIDPYSVHSVRTRLAQQHPDFIKQEKQSVASHAIDALCVFAVASSQHSVAASLHLGNRLASDPASLIAMQPSSISIKHLKPKALYRKQDISSRQLFKANIASENFFNLWLDTSGLRVGFDPNQALLVTGSNPIKLAEYLLPFFKQNFDLSEVSTRAKPVNLPIDKQKALSHLHQVAKQPCSEEAVLQAKLLDSLRFTTQRKGVKDQCTNIQKKFTVTPDQILNKSNFKIKVKLPSSKDFKLSGELIHPVINDWKALINQVGLRELIGSGEPWNKDTDTRVHEYFKAGSQRAHRKVRNEFSLPVILRPSGGQVRVRRKHPQGGYVWQLHTLNDTSSLGLSVEEGIIQWGKPATIETFSKSPNIHERTKDNKTTIYSPITEVVMFDQWLPIYADVLDTLDTRVEIAPANKDRRYIRVRQPFSVFQQWVKDCDAELAATPLGLNSEVVLCPNTFSKNHGLKMLGKPRDEKKGRGKLLIEEVGDWVCYWYRASESKDINSAYQQAYSKSLEAYEAVSPSSSALASRKQQAPVV